MNNFLASSASSLFNYLLNEENLIVPSFAIDVAITVITFVLMSIGIYTMAKRQNLGKRWLAFIPFFNYILLGRVVGNAIVWGKKIKNVGLWVTITSLISTILNLILDYGYYLVVFQKIFNVTVYFDSNSFLYLLACQEGVFYEVLSVVSIVPDIAYIFFEVSIIFMVFRMYAPERSLLYSLASVFIEPFFGILLFMVRNRRRYSREDFMRERAEFRAYDPFGSPNANNQNTNQNVNKKQEDPFPEFSEKKDDNKSDDYFS